jgi:hypothetical protein
MGINIPTYQELIANRIPMEEMAAHFGKIGTSYYNDCFESTFLSTISVVLLNDIKISTILKQSQ